MLLEIVLSNLIRKENIEMDNWIKYFERFIKDTTLDGCKFTNMSEYLLSNQIDCGKCPIKNPCKGSFLKRESKIKLMENFININRTIKKDLYW